ncbi:SH2B2-like protein [Mya arenaria]|uniref:SH2B2-like protein n=1 Tax=Mya arenaria TaxID=6604 RepID=A0ABY7DYK2_MYAAR|nr:SH2B2-like protein [Mya arenaria]
METLSLVSNGSPLRPGWMDFCDKHARSASEEFFASFLVYLKAHPTSEFRPRDPVDFAKKFVELFLKYFEKKIQNDKPADSEEINQKPLEGATGWSNYGGDFGGSNGFDDSSAIEQSFQSSNGQDQFNESSNVVVLSDEHSAAEAPSPSHQTSSMLKPPKGSILKRFSFRKIKQHNLFKQHSDEVELSSGSNENYSRERHLQDQKQAKRSKKLMKESKQKLPPLPSHPGQVKKEGIVYVFNGEDSKGKSKWEKTRLLLCKADKDYSLEFFSPPKSVKPKQGLFCTMITEARVTTPLEMPDHQHSFVLKGAVTTEYIIEAPSQSEMNSWLAALECCISPVQHLDASPFTFGSRGLSQSQQYRFPDVWESKAEHFPGQRKQQSTGNPTPSCWL